MAAWAMGGTFRVEPRRAWQARPGVSRNRRGRGYTRIVRILGLDVGDVRIGMALSDETATLATGLPTFERIGPQKDVKAVAALARTHEVGEVVVGLPRTLAGEIGPQAEKVLAFVEDAPALGVRARA